MCDETTLKTVKQPFVWLASDGQVMASDNGTEIPDLCGMNWVLIFVEKMVKMGYDPNGWTIHACGTSHIVSLEKDGYHVERP